jgi:hypothetical protein
VAGDTDAEEELDQVSEGRLLFVKSLGERLHAAGKTLAAVSSGSSGSALLLNHRGSSLTRPPRTAGRPKPRPARR